MNRVRKVAAATGLLLAVGGLASCGTYRAERQGKQAGDAICNVKRADAGDVERAIERARRQINDLQRIVGRPVNEDVNDIANNLSDLVSHVRDGKNTLAQQDISAIERNVHAVARTLNGKGKAAYDGVQEGLGGCDYQ